MAEGVDAADAMIGRPIRLDAILTRAAQTEPDRLAVICNGVSRSYAQVNDRARRLAGTLAALGVEKGDRVALWAANRAEFLEVLFGIPLLGAIPMPLDHWWKEKDAFAALDQARPKVLIAGAAQAKLLTAFTTELEAAGVEQILSLDDVPDTPWLSYEQHLAAAEPLARPAPATLDDPALILFTSGSTGRSKAAVHSHRSVCAAAMIMNLEFRLRDGERTLHFLPLFSSCLEHLIPLTLTCATHVIMPQFDGAAVWDAIARHGITHLDSVPTTLRRMLEHAPAEIPDSLRLIWYASEPMPAPLLAELLARLPGTEFVQIYGMIEQLCLTVQSPSQQRSKPGTVGRPMLGAELRILDEAGEPVAEGEPGEIFARSPTRFTGYWQDPEATASVVRDDGWMKTGDIGRLDSDGFLTLTGRAKEVIKSGGVTVIPNEVEAALLSHEAVKEVAVIGVPDETWGEAVHAFVVLHGGTSLADTELLAYCRTQLPGYKTPKALHFLGDLPRTGIGKISRREVREQYLRTRDGGAAETI
jgi:acyl-CoA synthetase (AMP-forming)/AMP-acid ligase II